MLQEHIDALKAEMPDGVWRVEQRGKITFLHADNIKFMAWAIARGLWKHWHVAIVDPPYGINAANLMMGASGKEAHLNRGFEVGDWDKNVPDRVYHESLNQIARDVVIWGGNYFLEHIGIYFKERPLAPKGNKPGRCYYQWDKLSGKNDFADSEIALTTLDSNARIIKKARNHDDKVDGPKRHTTQKPSYLYEHIHLDQDLRGKRVLDTHGGSFSHAFAAKKCGVELTIMDISQSFFESGLAAFDKIAAVKPEMLF